MPPLRLVVTGPESTGKSTLAEALAEWLRAPLVREFSRVYAEHTARPLTADDVEPIARGQVAAEDAAYALMPTPHLVVLDTDLVSTCVYAEHYYQRVPTWIADEARRRRADLYLLCAVDIPWSADGVRDRPSERHSMLEAFRVRLMALECRVLPVSGLGPRRLEHAIAAVRGWRAAQTLPVDTSSGSRSAGASLRVTR